MNKKFKKVEIPNPKRHYVNEPKTISAEAISLSENERILKREDGPNGVYYLHQYKSKDKWRKCSKCGDLLGRPPLSRGGTWPSVESIKESCSMYDKY